MNARLALAALCTAAASLAACRSLASVPSCPDVNGVSQRMTSTGECTQDAFDFSR